MGTPLGQLSPECSASRIIEPFMEELGERKEIISGIGNAVQTLAESVVRDPKKLDPATLSKILTNIAQLQAMNPVSQISKKQKIGFWLKKRGVTVLYAFFALGSSSALGSIVSAIYQYSQFSNCQATLESKNFYNATSSSSDETSCYLTLAPVILSSLQLIASITGSVFARFQKKQFEEEEEENTRRLRELITLTASENAAAKQWKEFFTKFQRFHQTARCEQRRASAQEELLEQTTDVRELLDCYRNLPRLPIFPMHFTDAAMADVLIRTLPDHSPVHQVMEQFSSRSARIIEQTPVEELATPPDDDQEFAHSPLPLSPRPTLRPDEIEMDECPPHEIPLAHCKPRLSQTCQTFTSFSKAHPRTPRTPKSPRMPCPPSYQDFRFPSHVPQQSYQEEEEPTLFDQEIPRDTQLHYGSVPFHQRQPLAHHVHPTHGYQDIETHYPSLATQDDHHIPHPSSRETRVRRTHQVFREQTPQIPLPQFAIDPELVDTRDFPFSQTSGDIPQHLRQQQVLTERCITPIHIPRLPLSTLIEEQEQPPPDPRLLTRQQEPFRLFSRSAPRLQNPPPPRLSPREQEYSHPSSRVIPREQEYSHPSSRVVPREQELPPPSPRLSERQQEPPRLFSRLSPREQDPFSYSFRLVRTEDQPSSLRLVRDEEPTVLHFSPESARGHGKPTILLFPPNQ